MKRVIFIPEVGRLVAPITVFVAFVSLAAAGSAQARADSETEVSCGQTLKASVRLANDLVDCSANGLIIGANNITSISTGTRSTGQQGRRYRRAETRECQDPERHDHGLLLRRRRGCPVPAGLFSSS